MNSHFPHNSLLVRKREFCYTNVVTRSMRTRRGFTLIELLVVILIIGVLSAISMPQYWKTIERNKVNEAGQLVDSLRGAADRDYAKYHAYCLVAAGCNGFDLTIPPLHYFAAFNLGPPGAGPGWKATLTRNGSPALYGAYVISADVEQGGSPVLSCSQPNCVTDLLPTPLH